MATHLRSWETYWLQTNGANPGGTYIWDGHGRIQVYLESQDTINNTSRIRIDHYFVLWIRDLGYSINATASSSYRANGGAYGTVTGSATGWMYGDNTLRFINSTYHTVSHNTDGTGTLSVNGSIDLTLRLMMGTSQINVVSGNRASSFSNVALPKINRTASITSFTASNDGLSSIKVTWGANATIDAVQYSLNGGAWTNTSGTTFYISGLNPGTQYNVKIRVRRQDSGLWTESGTQYATTTSQATITNSNVNFNIDDGISISFNNPSGKPVNLRLETLSPTTNRLTRTSVTSPYNLVLTQTEKDVLFGLVPNDKSLPVRIVVDTIDGSTYHNWKDGTASITNANPTFTNFTYSDINTKTTALTGNNQRIIKGFSNVRGTVTTSNRAIAIKGSSMVEYQFTVGTKQDKKPYSSSSTVNIDLTGADVDTFIMYAIDSRGNSTEVRKTPTMFIDYISPLILEMDIWRTGGIGDETNIIFSGEYFNQNFGSKTNSVTCTYRYRKTGDPTWTPGGSLTLVKNGKNFSFNGKLQGDKGALGFNASNSYYIEITVQDELDVAVITGTLGTGSPNIAIHSMGTSFGAPYDEELGGSLQVDGKRIDGSGGSDNLAVYEGGNIDPNTTLHPMILTGHVNKPPNQGGAFYFITTYFYNYVGVDAHRSQFAIGYTDNRSMWMRTFQSGSWSAWKQLAAVSYGTGAPGTLLPGEIYIQYS